MVVIGILLFLAMNALNNRENKRVVRYVTMKAEEMMMDRNSRQNFNSQFQNHYPGACASDGPNGIK